MAKEVLGADEKPLAKGWSGQPVWDLAIGLAASIPTGGKLLDAPSGGGYQASICWRSCGGFRNIRFVPPTWITDCPSVMARSML